MYTFTKLYYRRIRVSVGVGPMAFKLYQISRARYAYTTCRRYVGDTPYRLTSRNCSWRQRRDICYGKVPGKLLSWNLTHNAQNCAVFEFCNLAGFPSVFSARCNIVIYTSRAYATMSVSVCPSVCDGSALAHYS